MLDEPGKHFESQQKQWDKNKALSKAETKIIMNALLYSLNKRCPQYLKDACEEYMRVLDE